MNSFFQFSRLGQVPEVFHAVSYRSLENLEQFLAAVNVKNYVLSEQIHEKNIFIAENITKPTLLSGYDAFVTKQTDLGLIVKTADCTPILLYDPKQKVIAAVHAGRKSTLLQITELTVKKMQKVYKTNPADIMAGIGPAICNNCYQIDREKDLHFDLWTENKNQLLAAGVLEKNIELSGLCPACNANDRFFSYRKDKTQKRTYNLIMLKPSPV